MLLIYAYAGFSIGVAVYFLYLAATGLRTPEITVGVFSINLFNFVAVAFVVFTLYVVFKLREKRS